jgi:hypothetical protein
MPEAGAARIRAHPATTPSITGVIAIAPPAISRPRPVSRAARVGIGGTASLVGMVMVAMFGHLPSRHRPRVLSAKRFREGLRKALLSTVVASPTDVPARNPGGTTMFPETLIAMTRIADMKRDCPIDEPSVRGDSAAARSAARDGHPRRPGRPDRCRGQRIGRAATA